jgi:hypothetical protein
MSHFAKIENNIVTQVIVAEQDFIDMIGGEWVQTSYNTIHGKHLLGGEPLRGNYAGRGFTYDRELDVFIPIKQFDSWVLNTEIYDWVAPIQKPDYPSYWDEEILDWVKIIIE